MKRWLSALFILLALVAAPLRADDTDGLPVNGGLAAEIGPEILTEAWPWIRVTAWCGTPGTPCQGTLLIQARTCPTCPFKRMKGIVNPAVPDANGEVDDVYLAPRMYSYRCNQLADYSTGKFACHVERIK